MFFPFRILVAAPYTDFFRACRRSCVIILLGYGIPALSLQGVPNSDVFWASSRCPVYSAYVAEVYRAGIESVHPSQVAAARSLGLTRLQSLRHVVVPQAIRRVIPPLLNDFISLQKDTALVGVLGVDRSLSAGADLQLRHFNFTPCWWPPPVFIVITIPQARFIGLADRAGTSAAPSGGTRRRDDERRSTSRASTSRSTTSRCCGGSI